MRDKVYLLLAGLFRFPMKRDPGSHSVAFVIIHSVCAHVPRQKPVTQTICPFWVQRRRKVAAAWERLVKTSPELALKRRGA